MKFYSDQNRTCFQYESGGYALTSGNRTWIGLVQTHTMAPNMNVIDIRYQGDTTRGISDFSQGVQEWMGTFTYFPQDFRFLGFAIGSIYDLTGSHTFTENNGNNRVQTSPTMLTSFTIEDSKQTSAGTGSNFVRTTVGAVVDSWKMTAREKDVVSCDVKYIAQSSVLSSGAVTALTPTTSKPYVFNNLNLFIPSGTLIDNAKEVTFTISNNLQGGAYLNGSPTITEIIPLNRDYEVTATTDMDANVAKILYENLYTAGSLFNSLIMLRGITGSLAIVLSGCRMTTMPIPSPAVGRQEQSFTFKAGSASATAYDSISKYNAW